MKSYHIVMITIASHIHAVPDSFAVMTAPLSRQECHDRRRRIKTERQTPVPGFRHATECMEMSVIDALQRLYGCRFVYGDTVYDYYHCGNGSRV